MQSIRLSLVVDKPGKITMKPLLPIIAPPHSLEVNNLLKRLTWTCNDIVNRPP